MTESWGRGTVFGVMPLADGRVYCYAATEVVRWSRRAATMTTWSAPAAVALRNTLVRVTGLLAPRAALRGLAPVYDWRPPG